MSIAAKQTSLWELPAGGSAIIAEINGELDAATQRLMDIGFDEYVNLFFYLIHFYLCQ